MKFPQGDNPRELLIDKAWKVKLAMIQFQSDYAIYKNEFPDDPIVEELGCAVTATRKLLDPTLNFSTLDALELAKVFSQISLQSPIRQPQLDGDAIPFKEHFCNV